MKNFDRYGTVEIDEENRITGFKEKEFRQYGFINGGIYLIRADVFKNANLPQKFSFEKDFLEKYYQEMNFYGLPFDDYFIDIGIPEDYERAKRELSGRVSG